MKTLSVIIPVYNEEPTIETLLDKVKAAIIPGIAMELVIVNDGSNDASPEIMEDWCRRNKSSSDGRFIVRYFSKENGGKGSAVRYGIQRSTGDVVIIQDADLEYDPVDYEKCIRPILSGECQVVYGSREEGGSSRMYSSPGFYFGALSLTCWMNLLFNACLTDEPTCYKTFDGRLIRAILFDGNAFEWEPEITAKVLRLGCEIREIPIAYYPRCVSEGKKIRFSDGIQGFWTAFKWRFKCMKDVREKAVNAVPAMKEQVSGVPKSFYAICAVFLLALVVRVACALPGFYLPELLMRIDSASYLAPAQSLIADGTFSQIIGSDIPSPFRTPLYPAFLALCLLIGKGSLGFCIAAGCFVGALAVFPIYLGARLFGSWKAALLPAVLFAVHPTAIALSPMFLSDTLFMTITAFAALFIVKFVRSSFGMFFFFASILAAAAALTRPVNAAWFVPCLAVLWFMRTVPVRRKFYYSLLCAGAFLLVLGPWTYRNHTLGAGFRLDVVQTDALLHNASALESRITGEKELVVRKIIEWKLAEDYGREPEKYRSLAARLDHAEDVLSGMILCHPIEYVSMCLRPYVLLPDVPSLMENMGITLTGRGTFDVLNREGVYAAALHYFGGNRELLRNALVLAFPAVFIIVFAFGGFIVLAFRKDFIMLFTLFAFSAYYVLMPGAVAMPRYQLPLLPFLCFASSVFADFLIVLVNGKKSSSL